ncbi:hypothetical protein [Nocardia asteroides]|uniref:hypothetical protein n=1 Tax=Nocardia asteroides TaxID=1824 RepID=UPI001E54C63E|nr:hypothetical protein [Nocardia asteroides]UGT59117.1 hypothetical protein LTT61_17645 [Nocardia asteroides]
MRIKRLPAHSRTTTYLDLVALLLILGTVVVLVAIDATSAVLAAAGGTTALCYRAWREHGSHHRESANPHTSE